MFRGMLIKLILLLTSFRGIVYGLHNVTVYSQDSQITYSPGDWSLSQPNSLDAGGNHMLTQHSTGTATFTFTGIEIIASRI
jgi:hypothetical protein